MLDDFHINSTFFPRLFPRSLKKQPFPEEPERFLVLLFLCVKTKMPFLSKLMFQKKGFDIKMLFVYVLLRYNAVLFLHFIAL